MNKPITSITSYIEEIQKINKTENEKKFLFYRGVSNVDYCLIPRIFRIREQKYNERDILLDYKHYLPQFSPHYIFPRDILNMLIDMQHYGIPTRLLDWTTSPLNALYFACADADEKSDGKVFILNPWKLWKRIVQDDNKINSDIHQIHIYSRSLLAYYKIKEITEIINKKYLFKVNKEDLKEKIKYPFPFISSFSNNRIVVQKGCFTIHGTNNDCMECLLKNDEWYKIIIDKESKKKILEELNLLGIDDYSVFPDYEGMRKAFERKGSLFNNKFN